MYINLINALGSLDTVAEKTLRLSWHLVYQMLKNLRPEERHKTVYIVSSDTLVENPLIKIYLDNMLQLLREAAKRDHLPLSVNKVTPEPDTSFWTNVIGRGFPTPRLNGTFRWCTDPV